MQCWWIFDFETDYKIFKTELYLFRFVLLTLLTAGIHFKFKRLGFCILLLIKWFSRWNMTQKSPKITRIYYQLNQYLLLIRYYKCGKK
jgi:hypothetical protein